MNNKTTISTSIHQDRKTYIVPKRNRLALVQQPDPPVQSVTRANFSQADSTVVELAIVCPIVRASSSLVFLTARSLRSRWRSRRLRKKPRRLGQTRQFGKSRAWRRSIRRSSQSGDHKGASCVHCGDDTSNRKYEQPELSSEEEESSSYNITLAFR